MSEHITGQAWLEGVASRAAVVVVACACAVTALGAVAQVNLDAQERADFRQRVDRYMALRATLQKTATAPKPGVDVGPNQVLQRELAGRIRAARHDARQGEIFTSAVAATLRAAMNPQLRGTTAAGTRASIRDDAPARFALHVNDAYPDGASLPTVPPNVLDILPPLPEGIEYRIVDTHLILMDVDAAIIVDYIFDVMCARC
jgi:hypothetical protein